MEKLSESNQKHKDWVYREKIPEEICDIIVKDFKDCECCYGTIGIEGEINHKTRFVKIVNVPSDHWCLGIPMYFGFDANIMNFKYNITHLDFTNFLIYEKGMFYVPHNDISSFTEDPTHFRKLTVIVQLSNENDYEGGDVILYDSTLKPFKMPRQKGSIIVFDSSITHSVSKIKSGVRYSLCGWIMGPPFA